tara:strand:+ start:65 stop:238 length:174 start_codon:yes stop_codon:yes gene_type:complete
MKTFSDIKLGMLVETHKGIGRIVGISENFSCEIELEVQILEGKEEFFIMQSEVTYID